MAAAAQVKTHNDKQKGNHDMDSLQKMLINAHLMKYDPKNPMPSSDMWNVYLQQASQKYGNILHGQDIIQQLHEMNVHYMETYMKQNEILMMNRDIMQLLDIIDIRKLMDTDKNSKQDMPRFPKPETTHSFLNKTGWLGTIPCMNKAMIRINTFRYIYYEVSDADIENKNYILFIQDYLYEKGNYIPGTGGIAKICFDEEKYAEAKILENTQILYTKLYRTCSAKDLKWTDMQYQLFNDTIIKYSDDLGTVLEKYGTNQFSELIMAFIAAVILINKTLYENKKNTQKKNKKHDVTTQAYIAVKGCPPPEKIIQKVGSQGLTIKSEKEPKMPTIKSVTEYRTAQWSAKGYIRTYKNGKTVRVKPSVRHRKALMETNGTTQQEQNESPAKQHVTFVKKKHAGQEQKEG